MNPVIICVDDEAMILESLRQEVFNAFGYQYDVEIASSGAEAIELLEALMQEGVEVPLVLADYIMPGMKGDEVLEKVHKVTPNTMKIMLTGQASIEGIIYAINHAQLYRYISKPWEKEDLKLAIKEACDKYNREKILAIQNAQLKEMNQNLEQKIKERTQQLAEKNKQLEEMNELKTRLLSIVSHDIKSPLASLQSVLVLLGMDALTQEEIKNLSNNLSENIKKTMNFLESLLQWARIQMQGIYPLPTLIVFSDILNEIFDFYHDAANAKNIQFESFISPDVKIFADKEMVKTILRNLIANAIKFTPKQGKISVNYSISDNFTTISVSDTGVGIAKEDLSKIFNISETFTTKGTHQEKGTGMGLAICKELVEKNGGKIWVESQQNQGSKFYFSLPSTSSK
ncbi:MAG: response regulator [Flammeovirgaceae bacterium]